MKLFLVVCCAFLINFSSQAQARFDVGLKAGLNFANIGTSGSSASASVSQNYSNRTGYHFGAYALIKIAKFGIQPEVIFSRQGQTYQVPSTSGNFTQNYDYVNIPIIIKFYLAAGLNLQAGPQFGFLANQSSNVSAVASSGQTTTAQLKDLVKSSDVSLGLGLGWDLPFGLSITGRYNLGLSDLNKQSGVNNPLIQSSALGIKQAKNQVFQFSVGYRLFKLGK